MDIKMLVDEVLNNGRPLLMALVVLVAVAMFLRSKFVQRVKSVIEHVIFENWQLALLATTGIVLSFAAGWRTWEGMYNFTGEPLLSAMVTFGIQGIMLIVAWLIGESFATGMNMRADRGQSSLVSPASQTWFGIILGVMLFVVGFMLFLQWSGGTDVRQAGVDDFNWSKTGDKLLMFAGGLLLIALFALYAASDMVRPYIQGFRVIVKNSMLWIMFLACMATSVFFSFDSFFSAIFPQSERVRAAELRAQNQVAGILADIEQTIAARQNDQATHLFTTEVWTEYDGKMAALSRVALESEGAIERYVNDQIEERRRNVSEQQERMASATAGQAGLANRKTALTEEKGRLVADRPALATEYAEAKSVYDGKVKEADAKRVEAMAEDKGVEGSGKEGRGPIYRQRMSEYNLLQAAAKIAQERLGDAQKRLSGVEGRLSAIDRELATIDGDLAKLKGEAQTAEQRIKVSSDAVQAEAGQTVMVDPARVLPAFERARADFRAGPTAERLAAVQKMCGDIYGALSATPETKSRLDGIECDPKATADAAGGLFALQAGIKTFEQTCVGGDKLTANTSADSLFAFARTCLADSALPSKDTDELRTKINYIELSRDDKAHRFVVTLNAFQDGNRLAYLALAIAIGLDGLIFLSGLFGANALRSPLSDVPTNKSRSAQQLEATINAALGPQPYDTAWLTLNSLRPITNQDGFSALADLSQMERSAAERVRMVLTAGADIGAVETVSLEPERYRVRSELREYLSVVCDKHFKTNSDAKDRAHLKQLITAALAPHPREHADIVLHTLDPIRETEGFTSMVTLSDVSSAYESRIVRRVMNAGATVKAVAPDRNIDDRYYIRPSLYEVLLTICATAPESANYTYDRARFEGVEARPPIEAGVLRTQAPELPAQRTPELPAPKPVLPRVVQLTPEQEAALLSQYRDQLLSVFGLSGEIVDQRFAERGSRDAILGAWRLLNEQAKKNELLSRLLRAYANQWDREFSNAYSELRAATADNMQKRIIAERANSLVEADMSHYMMFPEVRLVDDLISEIESAAQPDDGLQPGEQQLLDQLRGVREALKTLDLSQTGSWDEIRKRLTPKAARDAWSDFNKRFAPKPDNDGDDEPT